MPESKPDSKMWKAGGDSHPGRARQNNEDRLHYDVSRGIFIVVDGVGGQAAGEKAADIALSRIRTRLERRTGTVIERVKEAITVANNEIFRVAQSKTEWHGMACVLTVALVENGQVTIGHVGDTRLYKIRDGQILKVTHDHSPVGEREDAGELSETDAMRHPRRNEVYRVVGSELQEPDGDNFIEIIQIPFEPDSAILLCTDGLTDLLSSNQILKVVENCAGDPNHAVKELIDLANAAGGKDNISLILGEGNAFRKHGGARRSSAKPALDHILAGTRRHLFSPWSLVIYGAIAGILIVLLLQNFQGSNASGDGKSLFGHTPATLVVSFSNPDYPTINHALEKAQPGDVIEVSPGEYAEEIQLKEGVALISQKPLEAVIKPGRTASAGKAVVSANGVEIARFVAFRIECDPQSAGVVGLSITNSGVTVDDVEITGASGAALRIDGHSNATVHGGYFHDNPGTGILVAGDATPRLTSNLVSANGTMSGKPRAGVEIIERANPVMERNVIADNGVAGITCNSPLVQKELLKKKNFFSTGPKTREAGPQKQKSVSKSPTLNRRR